MPSGPPSAGSAGGYPRFSPAERARRWQAFEETLAEAGLAHALVYGAERQGPAVQWLTGWPVTREAVLVWWRGGEPQLLVEHANHLDSARELAQGVEVRWGQGRAVQLGAELLRRAGAAGEPVGVAGPLPARSLSALQAAEGQVRFVDDLVQRLRLRKSPEELAWLRVGAALTDRAVDRWRTGLAAGATEAELLSELEVAAHPLGATTSIHYLALTAMDDPDRAVPAQWPRARRVRPGDLLACEVSVSWWGYPGQLLRTFTVGADPTPTVRRLHELAEQAFAAMAAAARPGVFAGELADAARRVLEPAGVRTVDDLAHGFGGGYLPPVLPGGNRPGRHDAMVIEEGMAIVLQPNVVDPERPLGVQVGELGVVTDEGWRSLHQAPWGLERLEIDAPAPGSHH
ncbi:M24 family metallopeptidase [Aciditerrimonas ferrireducens]|uniref:M24 family metallopeptidase n=1 Tax=Aciditerrimonas ferrireducens TaxID=667306 RepID=A0ABV6C1L6_9ACTN